MSKCLFCKNPLKQEFNCLGDKIEFCTFKCANAYIDKEKGLKMAKLRIDLICGKCDLRIGECETEIGNTRNLHYAFVTLCPKCGREIKQKVVMKKEE